MMKNPLAYFHIATFLLSGKSRNLSEYWKAEVIMRDKFVLHRLIRNGLQRQRGFLMWWRLANEMFISGNQKQRKCAIKIKNALMERYGCDIGLGARIGKGLMLPHHAGGNDSNLLIVFYVQIMPDVSRRVCTGLTKFNRDKIVQITEVLLAESGEASGVLFNRL